MKTILTIGIFVIGMNLGHAEVICECEKVWKGGDSRFFYGYYIDVGTVVGRNYKKALRECESRGRTLLYNPVLRNCMDMKYAERRTDTGRGRY